MVAERDGVRRAGTPQKGTGVLSGRIRCVGGVYRMRKLKYPSARNTGDPTATLTDSGRRPKLLTHHSGWRPNLSEVPESEPE